MPRPGAPWDRWLVFGCTAGLSIGFLLFPPRPERTAIRIELQAEAARDVTRPLEIREENDAERAGYLLFPSRVVLEDASVASSIRPRLAFTLPADGRYFLWARSKWSHVCANSFRVEIDGGPSLLIGNDEDFDRWHWVRVEQPIQLSAGSHELVISTTEADIRVDKFLLSSHEMPDLSGEPSGFRDELAEGAAGDWRPLSRNHWKMLGTGSQERGYRLAARQGEGLEYAIRSAAVFSTPAYLMARARRAPGASGPSDLAFLFNYREPDHYDVVRMGSRGVSLVTVRRDGVTDTPLSGPSPELQSAVSGRSEWVSEVRLDQERIYVWQGGHLIAQGNRTGETRGGVGIGSYAGGLDFQTIEARAVQPPALTNTFYLDSRPLTRPGGLRIVSGDWRSSYLYSGPETYALEGRARQGRGVAVMGPTWWTHFAYSSSFRIAADSTWAGLVYEYSGPEDYSLLRVRPGSGSVEQGRIQCVKRTDGRDQVLAESTLALAQGEWRILHVRSADDGVTGWAVGGPRLTCSSSPSSPGQIGLAVEHLGSGRAELDREPVFHLDAAEGLPFFFKIDLSLDYEDPGAGIVFLYQDPENYYSFGVHRGPEENLARIELFEMVNGITRRLDGVERKLDPGLKGRQIAFQVAVKVRDGEASGYLGTDVVSRASGIRWSRGRAGVVGYMPPSHADFDDVQVASIEEAPRETGSWFYAFNPTLGATRDLASWTTQAGNWGIGLSEGTGFQYTLLGRADAGGSASFRHRVPLTGQLRAIRLGLRPKAASSLQFEAGLTGQGESGSTSPLTVRVELQRAGMAEPMQGLATAVSDGNKSSAPFNADAWSESGWHKLDLIAGDGGGLIVRIDDKDILSLRAPRRTQGSHPYVSFSGAEGTVLGFRDIRVESAP